ncbi:MAG: thioredoxin domain-containing protein [Pseudomonadota bacterium]
MQKIIVVLCLAFAAAMPAQADDHAAQPALYSVLFYADWCGSCKVLDPAINKARSQADLDNERVLFLTLDLTDDTRRHQSGLLANALGIGEYYAKNEGRTGFMLLVDARTGKLYSRVTKAMDADAITVAVKAALDSTTS